MFYFESRPDRPLHLAFWTADKPEHQGEYRWVSGAQRPLCGEVGDGWQWTRPGAEKWRPRPVCRNCLSRLRALNEAAELAQGGEQ